MAPPSCEHWDVGASIPARCTARWRGTRPQHDGESLDEEAAVARAAPCARSSDRRPAGSGSTAPGGAPIRSPEATRRVRRAAPPPCATCWSGSSASWPRRRHGHRRPRHRHGRVPERRSQALPRGIRRRARPPPRGRPCRIGSRAEPRHVQSRLVERDGPDSTRSVAPLKLAPDAVYVDTTSMPIDVVVNHVMMRIIDKLNDLIS